MYLLLFTLWLILMGRVTAEILITGAVLTAALAVLIHILFDYTPKKDLRILKKVPLFIAYVFVLFAEIVKANLAVLRLVGSKRDEISPVLVTFRPPIRTELGMYILANSITLTPGTITVEIENGIFTVHCLSRPLLDISDDSVFIRWIRKMEA